MNDESDQIIFLDFKVPDPQGPAHFGLVLPRKPPKVALLARRQRSSFSSLL